MPGILDLPPELIAMIMNSVIDNGVTLTRTEYEQVIRTGKPVLLYLPDLGSLATSSKKFYDIFRDCEYVMLKRLILHEIPAGPEMYEMAVQTALLRHYLFIEKTWTRHNGLSPPRPDYTVIWEYMRDVDRVGIRSYLTRERHLSVLDWCRDRSLPWSHYTPRRFCFTYLTWPGFIHRIPEAQRRRLWLVCFSVDMMNFAQHILYSRHPVHATSIINTFAAERSQKLRQLLGHVNQCPQYFCQRWMHLLDGRFTYRFSIDPLQTGGFWMR